MWLLGSTHRLKRGRLRMNDRQNHGLRWRKTYHRGSLQRHTGACTETDHTMRNPAGRRAQNQRRPAKENLRHLAGYIRLYRPYRGGFKGLYKGGLYRRNRRRLVFPVRLRHDHRQAVPGTHYRVLRLLGYTLPGQPAGSHPRRAKVRLVLSEPKKVLHLREAVPVTSCGCSGDGARSARHHPQGDAGASAALEVSPGSTPDRDNGVSCQVSPGTGEAGRLSLYDIRTKSVAGISAKNADDVTLGEAASVMSALCSETHRTGHSCSECLLRTFGYCLDDTPTFFGVKRYIEIKLEEKTNA